MATSSCSSFTLIDHNKPLNSQLIHKNGGDYRSFRGSKTNFQLLQRSPRKRSSNKDCIIVRNATPEVAADLVSSSAAAAGGDLLSSFSLPTIPGFSDSPWFTGIAGLIVAVPFVIQRLLTLTKEVDIAAETVEKIADTVGKVAEEVDKAAEELAEALPDGGLKKVVSFVEDLAEETAKDAQKVEDLMDKVEELDDKLEAFLEKQSKGTEKA